VGIGFQPMFWVNHWLEANATIRRIKRLKAEIDQIGLTKVRLTKSTRFMTGANVASASSRCSG
jgi:hypothetical protein